MSNKKISGLDTISALAIEDMFAIADADDLTETKKLPLSDLIDFFDNLYAPIDAVIPSGTDGEILQYNGGNVLGPRSLLSYDTGEDMWDMPNMNFFYKNGNAAIHFDDVSGIAMSDEDGIPVALMGGDNRFLYANNGAENMNFWDPRVSMPRGLDVGNVPGLNGQLQVGDQRLFFVADFMSLGERGGNLFYNDGNDLTAQHVWSKITFAGSGEHPGFNTTVLNAAHSIAFSWDADDYGTRFLNHRLILGGNQTYIADDALSAIDGKIVQALDGNSGLNNYYRTGVIDSASSVPQYYDRIADESSNELQNILYLKGVGNGIGGGWTVPFQGWVNQQKMLNDSADTGWGFAFRDEAFPRFQIAGDADYDWTHRDGTGTIVHGFRNGRIMFNTNQLYTGLAPGILEGFIEWIDESGVTHYVPSYNF